MSYEPIYELREYVNSDNLEYQRFEQDEIFQVKYDHKNARIILSETNSLVEDEYCLNLTSARYIVEAENDKGASGNDIKEAMIHHHPKGHQLKHLQFKLLAKGEEVRIFIDKIDLEDYRRCIRGFLYMAQKIIAKEQADKKIPDNLANYFFNQKILELGHDRGYLISKIKEAKAAGQIRDGNDKTLDMKRLIELKKDPYLEPFLEW